MKQVQSLFNRENVEIGDEHRVLGSAIESESACGKFRNYKQSEYNQIVLKLSKHAKIFPQCVFHCFTIGLQNKVIILSRTIPNLIENLDETKRKAKEKLIPAMTGKSDITDEERSFSLPIGYGGHNIVHPEDRRTELVEKMAACLNNDDDAEAQQSLIVKENRKVRKNERKNINFQRKIR